MQQAFPRRDRTDHAVQRADARRSGPLRELGSALAIIAGPDLKIGRNTDSSSSPVRVCFGCASRQFERAGPLWLTTRSPPGLCSTSSRTKAGSRTPHDALLTERAGFADLAPPGQSARRESRTRAMSRPSQGVRPNSRQRLSRLLHRGEVRRVPAGARADQPMGTRAVLTAAPNLLGRPIVATQAPGAKTTLHSRARRTATWTNRSRAYCPAARRPRLGSDRQ